MEQGYDRCSNINNECCSMIHFSIRHFEEYSSYRNQALERNCDGHTLINLKTVEKNRLGPSSPQYRGVARIMK